MGEPAKKLPPEPVLPPLEDGDKCLECLYLVNRGGQLNTSCIVLGRSYDWGTGVSGVTTRIVAKLNGTALVHIRVGAVADGVRPAGGKFREFIFYPSGMYGAVAENDNGAR